MEQDKALNKVLRSKQTPPLPPDFNKLIMGKIEGNLAIEKKRSYWIGIALVSFASLVLIGLGVFLLKDRLPTDISFEIPSFHISSDLISTYGFSFYIAFLILILLGLDNYLRTLKQRKNKLS